MTAPSHSNRTRRYGSKCGDKNSINTLNVEHEISGKNHFQASDLERMGY